MLTYVVESDTDRTVDFLGVFKAGESRVFGQTDVDQFKQGRGVPNLIDAVPEGVRIVVHVTPDSDPDEEDLEPMSEEEQQDFEENVLHIDTTEA